MAFYHLGVRQEFCNWETFEAQCERQNVVMMTSAHYGRMKEGRCVQETYDKHGKKQKMGCSEDILRYNWTLNLFSNRLMLGL